MKFINSACAAVILAAASSVVSAQDESLDTELEKYSYSMGYSIGSQVLSQFGAENIELDANAFARAMRDAISKSEPAMDPGEMQAVVMARREKEMAKLQQQAEQAKTAGEAFLDENAQRDGVVTTDTGLQYEVVTPGTGAQPTAQDTVVVHYRGTLLDGTEFDSSYGREEPATFALEGIIKGWQEALLLMNEGARWKVFIPPDLAYGARGAGGRIGPNETLVFEIELLEVK